MVEVLKFEKNDEPNVAGNPLPNHTRDTVNVIIKKEAYHVKENLNRVKMLKMQV